MSQFVLDLTNFKDSRSARVPAGRYLVQVEDAELKDTRKGDKMVQVWLRIAEGEHKGATIIDRMTLTDKAMFRIVGFMQALNMPTPRKRLRLDITSFVGRSVLADIADGEPYNGNISSEIKGYAARPKTAQADDDFADLTDDSAADLPENDISSDAHAAATDPEKSMPKEKPISVTGDDDVEELDDLENIQL